MKTTLLNQLNRCSVLLLLLFTTQYAATSRAATPTPTVASTAVSTNVPKEIALVDANYYLSYHPVREGNYLYLHLSLVAENTTFKLGTANLQFKYKSTVLNNPTLISSPLSQSNYTGITFTTPNLVGIAADDQLGSLNFDYAGTANNGLSVPMLPNAGLLVAIIRFDIVTDALTPNFRTYENDSRGTRIYTDAAPPSLIAKGTNTGFDNNDPISMQIAYNASSFCKSEAAQTVQITQGITGGTYFATPGGLALNQSTGTITPSTSTPNLYTVYYYFDGSNRGGTSTTVTIKAAPTPNITNLDAAYCSDISAFTLTGTPLGGNFQIDGVAATTLNPFTLTEGSHVVKYTVTNDELCTAKKEQTVTINAAPVLVTGLSPISACVGSPIDLNASFTGTNLTYSWRINTNTLIGATTNNYHIENASTEHNGLEYTLTVVGCSQTPLVERSVLTISTLPTITRQPMGLSTCFGTPSILNVEATGTNLTYQWKRGGNPIPNATGPLYTIQSFQREDLQTPFTVEVSGYCAPAVTSNPTYISHIGVITIQRNPVETSVCLGAGFELSVEAIGSNVSSNDMTYQWQKNGSDISGATAATYSVQVATANDVGSYRVLVGTLACHLSEFSSNASVSLGALPTINTQPAVSTTVCAGSPLQLSVVTAPEMLYQWQKDGVLIPNATMATYSVPAANANHAGTYNVLVHNSIVGRCPTVSANAVVIVNEVPAIVTQPAATLNRCVDSVVVLSVVASGSGLTYQWKKDGNPISGATNAAFNIASATLASAGTYKVVISGVTGCGSPVTSADAVLGVGAKPAAITGAATLDLGSTTTFANTIAGGVWSSSDATVASVHATTGVVTGVAAGLATIIYTVTNPCGVNAVNKPIAVLPNKVTLNLKVFLEGNYDPATNLMSDDLRMNNLIPLIEPFTNLTGFTRGITGGETMTNTVLTVTGANAIVDWILIELRSKTSPSTVLYTRAALLQRDGDIVDIDGTSALTFIGASEDNYYVAVRHRNHLGFRTSTPKALALIPTGLNFTNGSQTTFGIEALRILNGVSIMYAGEGDGNGVINATDLNNVWLLENGMNGYKRSDFDLNGVVNAIDRYNYWRINNSRIEQLD
jgi:Bacterial Ig-like domain (group 2)